MARQLTILHISDLHARSTEGVNDQRKRQVRLEKAGRTRVLGAAFVTDLKELFVDKKPDIICFTGDIADWGLPGDYKEASKDLDRLLSELGVAKSRFFLVPGNHDVQRTVEEETWKDVRAGASVQAAVVSKWMAGVGTPHDLTDEHRTAVMSRTGAFWAWVEEDLERPDLLPKNSPHEQLGYRHTVRLPDWPFDIHVVGLDSAWLAGDDHDAGKLRLTPAQVDLLTTEKDGHALSGFRIGLVHHPLSDLADGEDAGRRLADTLDLLLHGHQHDPVLKTLVDPDRSLRVLAAGCLFEGQERDDYKNSYQRIDIWLDDEGRPQHGGVQFRGWSPRGHWYADASLYKNAPGGRLAWNPWSSDKPALARPKPAAPPTGVFIGRESELLALKKALVDSDVPEVSAIYGMAGVGKSYLALRFAREQTVAFPGGIHSLALQNSGIRSAAATVAQLAEQINVAPAELAQRLLSPRSLLVVDNVDTESNAKLAAELVDHLPGSPILFTGRYHEFGYTAGWVQLGLDVLETPAAVELLKRLSPASANGADDGLTKLAEALGRLPLALYLSAGHLRRGLSPGTVLSLLQSHDLDLKPLDPADPLLRADAIRARLSSSLSLSWETFTDVVGQERAMAFARIGHLPSQEFGLQLGAAVSGFDEAAFAVVVGDAVGLSLIQHAAVGERWSVHPLVQSFLAERSPGDEVSEGVRGWFETMMAAGGPETVPDSSSSASLHAERGNLLAWLATLPAAVTTQVLANHGSFARVHGPFNAWADAAVRAESSEAGLPEHLRLLTADLLRLSGRPDAALSRAKNVAETTKAPRMRADAYGRVADILENRAELAEVLRIRRDEQIPVYEECGDAHSLAFTRGRIADLLQRTGDFDEAFRIRQDEEIPVYEQLGNTRDAAIAHGKNADVHQIQGRLDEALRIRRDEQLPVFEASGDVREIAVAKCSIAVILGWQGQHEEALRLLSAQLPLFRELADDRQLALTYAQISNIHQRQGEFDEALRIRTEHELPTFRALGDSRGVALALGRNAEILEIKGDTDGAERVLREEVIPVLERIGDGPAVARARTTLGLVLFTRDPAEATRLLSEAYFALSQLKLPEASQLRDSLARLGIHLE